jgi:hypothetical protein
MKSIVGILCALFLAGCASSGTKTLQDSKGQAASVVEHLAEIKTSAANINTLTDDPSIHEETKNIDKHVADANKNVVALNKNNEKLGRDLQAERDSSLKRYKSYLVTISVISGIGIFVAGALVFTGTLRNFKLMVIAGCIFAGSITLLFVFQYLLYVALITALIVLGLIIYTVISNRALKQTWESIEQAKQDGVITWEEFAPIADSIQGGITKSLIDAWQKAKGHK